MALNSGRLQFLFDEAHQTVQSEADHADGDDAKDDVLVDQGVIFLPEEATDSRSAGQHISGHNHQPGYTETQTESCKHVWEGRRKENLEQCLGAGKLQNLRDVQEI